MSGRPSSPEFDQLSSVRDGVETASNATPEFGFVRGENRKKHRMAAFEVQLVSQNGFTSAWRTLHPAREDSKRGQTSNVVRRSQWANLSSVVVREDARPRTRDSRGLGPQAPCDGGKNVTRKAQAARASSVGCAEGMRVRNWTQVTSRLVEDPG